jgi:hypothetical protein
MGIVIEKDTSLRESFLKLSNATISVPVKNVIDFELFTYRM